MHLPGYIRGIIQTLNVNRFDAYVVGGCVRDSLMGRTPKDYDLATSALPEDIKRIFSKTILTGEKYGTVTVLTPDEPVEVTTFRLDGVYTDGRRPEDVRFTTRLEADLSRRDLTMNAVAYNDKEGYIDPFGGRADIAAKRIRTVGAPEKRFQEDALRILRVFRFAAVLGFSIEQATLQACAGLISALSKVSVERITAELSKALEGDYVEKLLPLFEMGGLSHLGFHKPAKRLPLSDVPQNPYCRWAALLYLCGGEKREEIPSGLRLDNRTRRLAGNMLSALYKRIPKTPIQIKWLFRSIPVENVKDYIELYGIIHHVNVERSLAMFDRVMENGEAWNVSMLDISGEDLMTMGIQEGRPVGEVLDVLCGCVLERPEINSKEILSLIAQEYKEKFLEPLDKL